VRSQEFCGGEQDGRSDGIDGTISRLVKDVYRFEVLPKRMCGIGEPTGCECVGEQKISEFIGDQRLRILSNGSERDANDQGQGADEQMVQSGGRQNSRWPALPPCAGTSCGIGAAASR
jgi:hypothetical protein